MFICVYTDCQVLDFVLSPLLKLAMTEKFSKVLGLSLKIWNTSER